MKKYSKKQIVEILQAEALKWTIRSHKVANSEEGTDEEVDFCDKVSLMYGQVAFDILHGDIFKE